MTTQSSSKFAVQGSSLDQSNVMERLLKGEDVADILQVSKSFAYQLIRCGDIPSVRLGRAVRVRLQDLERFIESNAYASNDAQFKGGVSCKA